MLNARVLRKRGRRQGDDDPKVLTLGDTSIKRGRTALPIYLLFECATGYALFEARGINQVPWNSLQAVEDFLKQSPFTLKAYRPFSSDEDALVQMESISNSLMSDQLLKFLEDTLPQPKTAGSLYSLVTVDSQLGMMISDRTRLGSQCGVLTDNIIRGLRMKIHEFIGLTREELENAQFKLARLYINQMSLHINPIHPETPTKSRILVSSSSSLQQVVRVVPHRFDGVFNVEGKENMLCTINLVPGEALYGEELVRGRQTLEDKTDVEVEYRVCNPLRSKLGAAILRGVDTHIKPGSRVLYVGRVCGLTISDLSDLVGSDGLVYVVGFYDDVVNMAGKRPNVVTIIERRCWHWSYRMLVGMVDIIFAEIDRRSNQNAVHPIFIVSNARFYLRAGGHYLMCTQANDIDSARQVEVLLTQGREMEFKSIKTVMLDLMEGAYALDVGGHRMFREI